MQKWTDRPASDHEDVFDAFITFANTFLSKHASLLAKAVPPLFGFGIFLLYFYRNQFYPSFDLFQFSSLLLAAACIGFVFIGLLVIALLVPGALIFHQFLNTKSIKEDVGYALPYSAKRRSRAALVLVGLVYFLPYLLCNAALIGLIIWKQPLFVTGGFLLPALIALAFGVIVQVRFELKPFSFFSYLWTAYGAVMLVGFLASYILIKTVPIINSVDSEILKWAVIIFIPVAVASIACVCSMCYFAGWTYALHFSLLFALLFGGYSGMLTTLPEQTVRNLGLGNYSAELVIFDQDFCDGVIKGQTAVLQDCTLRDAHIVWSLGETWVIRPQVDSGVQLQVPARYIKAIVRTQS